MARKAKGNEFLDKAKEVLSHAKTINEIKICQAVILPLEGLSLEQTAQAVGHSVSWVSRNRNAFIKAGGSIVADRRGGRYHANMTIEQEKEFLQQFVSKASTGQIVTIAEIHQELEKYLGRHVGLSSTYELVHRHNWRKVVPDKRHIKADVKEQERWKKNFRNK